MDKKSFADDVEDAAGDDSEPSRLAVDVSMLLGGSAALAIGGNLTVDGSVNLATAFGVSQMIIGLTIVAVGTSAPELVTSLARFAMAIPTWPPATPQVAVSST